MSGVAIKNNTCYEVCKNALKAQTKFEIFFCAPLNFFVYELPND